jgi:hypothetical protein
MSLTSEDRQWISQQLGEQRQWISQQLGEQRQWISQQFEEERQWTNRQIERVESRLLAELERVETRLLTEFHKWASPSEARARTHAAAIRALDLEMEQLSDRMDKLEKDRPPEAA